MARRLLHDVGRCPVCKVEFPTDPLALPPTDDPTVTCPNGHPVPVGDLELVTVPA